MARGRVVCIEWSERWLGLAAEGLGPGAAGVEAAAGRGIEGAGRVALEDEAGARVAVMYLGRIVETAPTQELFTNPRHPYTQGLLKAVPRLAPGRVSTAEAVVGDPPSPIHPPSGCRFHPRCPVAQQICHSDDPRLLPGQAAAGHLAACHFAWTPPPPAHEPEVLQEADGG